MEETQKIKPHDPSRRISFLKKIFLYMQLVWGHLVFYLFPTPTEDYYLNLGTICFKLGKYEKAIISFTKSEKAHGERDPAYSKYNIFCMGYSYLNLANYNKSIEYFEKYLALNPKNPKVYVYLGFAYRKSGKYKEAIGVFNQAINIKPDLADPYFNLGLVYGMLGEHEEAINAFKHTISIESDNAEAHYNLGYAYCKSGKYKAAIDASKQAVNIKPYYAEAHFTIGVAYLMLNDRASAIKTYETLKNLNSQMAIELLNRINQ